jgi:hypothetical protein
MRVGWRGCVGRRREGERVKISGAGFYVCLSKRGSGGRERRRWRIRADDDQPRASIDAVVYGDGRDAGCAGFITDRPICARGGVDFGRGTTMMRAVARPGWERTPEPSFVFARRRRGHAPRDAIMNKYAELRMELGFDFSLASRGLTRPRGGFTVLLSHY